MAGSPGVKEKEVASRHVDPMPRPQWQKNLEDSDGDFVRQRIKDEAAIEARKRSQRDKIGEFLGGNYYVTDRTWPFLMNSLQYQYLVSRHYPQINVALDIFRQIGPSEQKEIDFKRVAFAKAKIRYAAIDYSMELADIIPQIGV